MGLIRDAAAGAISGGAMGALQGAAGIKRNNKRAGASPSSTDVSGAGPIPFQEEYSDEGSGEGAKRPNSKRSNGKSRG